MCIPADNVRVSGLIRLIHSDWPDLILACVFASHCLVSHVETSGVALTLTCSSKIHRWNSPIRPPCQGLYRIQFYVISISNLQSVCSSSSSFWSSLTYADTSILLPSTRTSLRWAFSLLSLTSISTRSLQWKYYVSSLQSLACYYYSWNVLCQLVYLFWLCFELVFCYIFIIETKNVCTNVCYRLYIPYWRDY
jgi:hypothetical protein